MEVIITTTESADLKTMSAIIAKNLETWHEFVAANRNQHSGCERQTNVTGSEKRDHFALIENFDLDRAYLENYCSSPTQSLTEEQTMDLGCGTKESLSRSQSTVNLSMHTGTLRYPERIGIVT